MNLLEKLKEIFKGGDMNRIMDIEEVLIMEAISMPSDFVLLDEEMLVNMNYFKPIEIKKILKVKEEEAKSLKYALEEIFLNTKYEKLKTIRNFFEEEEVFTIDDLFMFGLANVTKSSDIFSDLDMKKIRNFIRKNYPEKFKEIKEKEDHDKNQDMLKFLNEEKLILLDIQKELYKALVNFVNNGVSRSWSLFSISKSGLTLFKTIGQNGLKWIFGGLTTVTVVSEITNVVSTIYTIKQYANNKQMIRDDLKSVEDRLIENQLKINEATARGGNPNHLTSDIKTSNKDKK